MSVRRLIRGVFDQAVLEQRSVRDSEDGELKQKQMKSLLLLNLPRFSCRKEQEAVLHNYTAES